MKVSINCVALSSNRIFRIAALCWYNGRVTVQRPILAICYEMGKVQIMRNENDDGIALFN